MGVPRERGLPAHIRQELSSLQLISSCPCGWTGSRLPSWLLQMRPQISTESVMGINWSLCHQVESMYGTFGCCSMSMLLGTETKNWINILQSGADTVMFPCSLCVTYKWGHGLRTWLENRVQYQMSGLSASNRALLWKILGRSNTVGDECGSPSSQPYSATPLPKLNLWLWKVKGQISHR